MSRRITIALAGNPNSGKSCIFNNLTGARQHVGNYPGVTVEKKEGVCRYGDLEIHVVDLPGTYSLTAYSEDELVARNFIIDEKPDLVVDIVDAGNLERNLYLATQLMELRVPMVLVLNMSDVAEARGQKIDTAMLSELLGMPIVHTVGHRNKGTEGLLDAIAEQAEAELPHTPTRVTYGREIEEELGAVERLLAQRTVPALDRVPARWLAVKLLEGDPQALELVEDEAIRARVDRSMEHLRHVFGDNAEIVIADRRYGFISGACQETVVTTVESRHSHSDKIDEIITHPVLGLPIFLGLMYLVFQLTFTLGEPPMGWIEAFFEWLGGAITALWPAGSENWVLSLIVDGIIGGVGGVIVFLPNIIFLFLAIALMEDSGYMARAAFIMDRVMHKIGLHGKSFIPMVIGFGCSVPAIMATRTLENRRDRLTTMLVIPLISCGARFPIYALIIPAFFAPKLRAPVLFSIYLIGVVLAVVSVKLLRISVFKGESTPFVMELPPYRMPTVTGAFIHTWERAWMYLRKAGTLILAVAIVLWAMTNFPKLPEEKINRAPAQQAAGVERAYEAEVAELADALGVQSPDALTTRLKPEAEARPGVGPRAAQFLDVVEAVRAEREAFEAKVADNELDADSPEYAVFANQRDNALEDVRIKQPELYRAALIYLDDIEPPLVAAREAAATTEESQRLRYSLVGRIGTFMEPVLRPIGFDWKIGTALVGAFAAKEVFVAQMGIVYAVGAESDTDVLRENLRRDYTPLVGFCIMLFCLISTPCVATVAVMKQESGSWKWALFQVAALTTMAYGVTFAVYQIGSRVG